MIQAYSRHNILRHLMPTCGQPFLLSRRTASMLKWTDLPLFAAYVLCGMLQKSTISRSTVCSPVSHFSVHTVATFQAYSRLPAYCVLWRRRSVDCNTSGTWQVSPQAGLLPAVRLPRLMSNALRPTVKNTLHLLSDRMRQNI